jgi:hypothetical protein
MTRQTCARYLEDYKAWVDSLEELKIQATGKGRGDLVDIVQSVKRAMPDCNRCQPTHSISNKEESEEEEIEILKLGEDGSNRNRGRGTMPAKLVAMEDWNQASLGRFSRPKNGPDIPGLPLRKIPWKDDFDDYFDAPSDEATLNLEIHGLCYQAPLAYTFHGSFVTPSPWSAFRDYGYRLATEFCQAFDLKELVRVWRSPSSCSS